MIENKKVFILGMAKSGYEAAKILSESGCKVLVTDMKEQDKNNIQELESMKVDVVIGENPIDLLNDSFDLMVKNPGIKYDNPMVLKARDLNIPVINEVELAYHYLNKDTKIIGVTGSNGKTTTVTLIYDMIKKDGKNVWLGGNIGTPLCNFVKNIKKDDILVMEISDHQLVDMYDFKTNISVLTIFMKRILIFMIHTKNIDKLKKKIFNNHTKK